MPAQISHILAGEAALFEADPAFAKSLGLSPRAPSTASASRLDGSMARESPFHEAAAWFRLGCQGPDIFYHNQRTKPSGIQYGVLAHRRDYGNFIEAAYAAFLSLRAGSEEEKGPWMGRLAEDAAFAYLLGLSTHAAIDRATHPFIVYFSGWVKPEAPASERYRACHPFFERILDVLLLRRAAGLATSAFDLETLLPLDGRCDPRNGEPRTEDEVTAMLQKALISAYPRATSGDFLLGRRIQNAVADARYFFRATNPARTDGPRADAFAYLDDHAGARSIAIVYPPSLPDGIDFANLGHAAWEHPAGDGRVSHRDYFELVDEGRADASKVLGLILDLGSRGATSEGTLAKAIGQGGLSITDASGRPARPLLSRPLPLPEFMEGEYRRRLEEARSLLH